MLNCPRCQNAVPATTPAAAFCPACGASLLGDSKLRGPMDGSSQTFELGSGNDSLHDEAELSKTIVGTMEDVHLLPRELNPPASPPPAPSSTLAFGAIPLPPSSGQTLELNTGLAAEPAAGGNTLQLDVPSGSENIGKTVQFSGEFPVTSRSSETGKTFDLNAPLSVDDDFSLTPPVDSTKGDAQRTVAFDALPPQQELNKTVASDDFSATSSAPDDSGRTFVMDEAGLSGLLEEDRIGGTVELDDAAAANDIRGGRTMVLNDSLDVVNPDFAAPASSPKLPEPSSAAMAGRTFVLSDAVVEKIVRDTLEVSQLPRNDQTLQLGEDASPADQPKTAGTVALDDRLPGTGSAVQPPPGGPVSPQPGTVPDLPGSQPPMRRAGLVVKTRSLRRPQDTFAKEGDYELLKILGEGGMGVVYTARQSSIHRTVAVKMIKPGSKIDDIQKQKFLAEAVVTGDLEHPNIVPIYDLGTNEQGALFYSMKKVQGTPWDKSVRAKSLPENLEILMKVADAVGFAHSKGVVHRDLKPENVMLGEFGEVLVMDWGLAISVGKLKEAGLRQAVNMGGTPAYMAPEMVTGPFDKIGPHSDIYLLGAMLFEIITGDAPHTGATPMKCLHSAARNEIRPTEKSGELLEVARQAMRSSTPDRYASVRDFQNAIREYQSHAESIFLSGRAEGDFRQAQSEGTYERFSRAVFGFQEAMVLWAGNLRARQLLSEVQLAYAGRALERGDFDLGISVLDRQQPGHAALREQLQSAQRERESRKQRLKTLRRTAILGTALFILVVVGAFFWIKSARDLAEENRVLAESQRTIAEEQKGVAEQQRARADEQRLIAEKSRDEAKAAQAKEAEARQEEARARKQEEIARKAAVEARDREEYEAYIAQIGLAAAKIEENEFGSAREILTQTTPALRNWEWGRLMHLCSQGLTTLETPSPLDAVAFAPDGKFFVTGGWNGAAQLWLTGADKPHLTLPVGAKVYVHGVAVSPDGKTIATAGSDYRSWIRLWEASSGKPVTRSFVGHSDTVLSVSFSSDGRKLLTSSYDKTARIWDVATGKLLSTLSGHTWWVWQAAFSTDNKQIVTVSQDGTALVWNDPSANWSDPATIRKSPPFTGHQGAVYTAAFSPGGSEIVSGGWDKKVLLWKPAEVKPLNFGALARNESPVPEARFIPLEGHLAAVRCVNFSPDGRFVLSGAHDNTVKAWDATSGKVIKTFRGHDSWVRGCSFSPDGEKIVSVSYDRRVKLWSVSGYGEERVLRGFVLQGHTDAVLAAAFSPDEKLIVTASRDNSARTWDMASGREIRLFQEGHTFLVSQARFSRNGRQLFTSAVDNTVRQWDIATGTQLRKFDHTGRSAVLAVSPAGDQLVTGSDHHTALFWNLGSEGEARELTGHRGEVTAAAYAPDGTQFVTGDSEGRCLVWDSSSLKLATSFARHTRRITALAFIKDKTTFSPRIVSASGDNTVANWDVQSGQEDPKLVLKHPDEVLDLALLANGRAVTTCKDHHVRVWDLSTAQVVGELGDGKEAAHSIAASLDGQRVLTVVPEARTIRIWDAETLREMLLSSGTKQSPSSFFAPDRKLGLVWSATFSPDGSTVATVGGREARLWDARSGRDLMSFTPHGTVASANFSPDGKRLVTGFWDNSARVWDLDSRLPGLKLRGKANMLQEGDGHGGFVNMASFSPDGKSILTASDDKTAKLWNAASGQLMHTFRGHGDRVRSATFSSDGSQILTASADKTARVWNTLSGKQIREFSGHRYGLLCAVFSKDSRRIATGSDDNSARIWDSKTGELQATLEGHTAAVTSIAFSPDGRRLLTGSQDFLTKLWDSDTRKEILTLKGHSQEVTSVVFSSTGHYALTGSRDGTAIIWLASDWHKVTPSQPVKRAGSDPNYK